MNKQITQCTLCGSKRIVERKKNKIWFCNNCKLQFTDKTQPEESLIDTLFEDH